MLLSLDNSLDKFNEPQIVSNRVLPSWELLLVKRETVTTSKVLSEIVNFADDSIYLPAHYKFAYST